ncbi:DUF922 domain-containing protein [Pseudomonas sp. PL-6]
MKRALLPLLLAAPLHAEVREQLDYRHYDAHLETHASLRQALNSASPIRLGGQTYHGFTRWQVEWRFWWREARDGRCRIERSSTQLQASITLPRLHGGDAQQQQRFARYLAALEEHELGHYRIGQAAAQAIDAALLALPEQADCKTLEQQANARAHATLQRHIEREHRYDRDTGHGETQGAWLDD